MGFLDSISSGFSSGKASLDRSTRIMRLKNQMNEAAKRRTQLVAQLGASLYEATRNDVTLRAGRESLYDGIAQCDAERDQCQYEIDAINAEAEAARIAAQGFECPRCHTHIDHGDMFCCGCGLPVAEMFAASDAPAAFGTAPASKPEPKQCPSCGAPTFPGDIFCMTCGAKLDGGAQPAASQVAQPTPGVSPYELAQARYGSVEPQPEPALTTVLEPAAADRDALDVLAEELPEQPSEQHATHAPAHMGAPLEDEDSFGDEDDEYDTEQELLDDAEEDDRAAEGEFENEADQSPVTVSTDEDDAEPRAEPLKEPLLEDEPAAEAEDAPSARQDNGPIVPGELRPAHRPFPVLDTSDAARPTP